MSPHKDAQTITFTAGGKGGVTKIKYDSYVIEGDKCTIKVRHFEECGTKPEGGEEGKDWIQSFGAYSAFKEWYQINATIVDGYVRIDSFTLGE